MRLRRPNVRAVRLLAAGLVVGTFSVAFAPAASSNTPGNPGTPSAPVPIYTENFENVTGSDAVMLDAYTGTSGMTYGADVAWLTNCNGAVVNSHSTNTPATGCSDAQFNAALSLATAIGNLNDPGTSDANHAVMAYTAPPNPGGNHIQFQTQSAITLPTTTSRFLAFSVDAAEVNCQSFHAALKFYLLDGTTEIPTFSTPIDPCGSSTNVAGNAGHYTSNKAVLFNGAAVGLLMRNGQGNSSGNDAAFDNVQLVDVTPQADITFGSPVVAPDEETTMTITITNTSDLGDKAGWSYHLVLPVGLTMVNGTSPTTTCGGSYSYLTPARTLGLSGATDLPEGQASCTITYTVKSATPGTYTIDPAGWNVGGLDLPATAELVIAEEVGTPMLPAPPAGGLAALLMLGIAGIFIYMRRTA